MSRLKGMTQDQFDGHTGWLEQDRTEIMESKRPAYTGESVNVLENFDAIAERLALQPEQVWAVYFMKHIDSIMSWVKNPTCPQGESLESRFADAMNYLDIGYAMMMRRREVDGGREDHAAFGQEIRTKILTGFLDASNYSPETALFMGETFEEARARIAAEFAALPPPVEKERTTLPKVGLKGDEPIPDSYWQYTTKLKQQGKQMAAENGFTLDPSGWMRAAVPEAGGIVHLHPEMTT